MAGLEVVVRPVVFPNIRPQAPRVLPPPNDPTQGFCTIGGGSGKVIDLPHSWTASLTHSEPVKELRRQVDKERHYQVDENGKVNKKNFIDVDRLKKVQFNKPDDLRPRNTNFSPGFVFADPPKPVPEDSVKVLERDVTINSSD